MLRSAFVCARFGRAGSPRGGNRGNQMGIFLVDGPPLVNRSVLPLRSMLGLNTRGGDVTVVDVPPLSLGSRSLGWGKALATAATPPSPPNVVLSSSLGGKFWERKLFPFIRHDFFGLTNCSENM